jgi:hypothetical protein
MIKQVLVQWTTMPADMAMWEDEADIPHQQMQASAD